MSPTLRGVIRRWLILLGYVACAALLWTFVLNPRRRVWLLYIDHAGPAAAAARNLQVSAMGPWLSSLETGERRHPDLRDHEIAPGAGSVLALRAYQPVQLWTIFQSDQRRYEKLTIFLPPGEGEETQTFVIPEQAQAIWTAGQVHLGPDLAFTGVASSGWVIVEPGPKDTITASIAVSIPHRHWGEYDGKYLHTFLTYDRVWGRRAAVEELTPWEGRPTHGAYAPARPPLSEWLPQRSGSAGTYGRAYVAPRPL